MDRKIYIGLWVGLLIICTGQGFGQTQTLKGSFTQLKATEITLSGYDGFREKELSKTRCDSTGRFTLSYPATYTGAAMLQVKGSPGVVVLLNRENFGMQWDNMQDMGTLRFTGSPENEALAKGIAANGDAEQKLSGLRYLLPRYGKNGPQYKWLQAEIAVQQRQFQLFADKLPAGSYAAKYLRLRKFVADMYAASNRRDTTGLAQMETHFAQLGFTDEALWHSGLTVDLFTGFYQLLEGYGNEQTITSKSDRATDAWIKALMNDRVKQQEVSEYCFKQLEKRNRIKSAEYLALAMLNQAGCQLDEKRTALFEQYRKMAEGNTAPDITLPDGRKLSELDNKYKLVVFGASWCPDCQKDYPSLVGSYKRGKSKCDITCVYVSLDTDTAAYRDFFREAPFTTMCDSKGWNSPAVKDYCVVATPTIYLLDEKLRIVKRITVPQQLETYM
jgi:thiol-disulfide isomerase/thioredoxin